MKRIFKNCFIKYFYQKIFFQSTFNPEKSIFKQSMNLNGQSRSIQLFKELKRRISNDSQVLLVCHKDSEHWYSSQEYDFRNFEVTHWGAIDGKNDWQDFDTVVIAGIPYRDIVWANNTFMAIRGL